jgi:NMD protein affecting ribosome stability and mRNA decay
MGTGEKEKERLKMFVCMQCGQRDNLMIGRLCSACWMKHLETERKNNDTT